ncbi:hypothetical protein [Actinoplanes derwentensis]|uniref:Uncharacterized protein n=1 Tax=Actinoplanes derwentensis TaxID=113562 RepID=A0A1H1ZDA0_9ACTN|nr:hypothetical protein [Actinoplanes derwentensis]GID82378.1 hypothetical protein Ade03nite_13020 [Actinoplanes derwentensis]SDT31633.1 hypothetical protein SAMN04489716_3261 [Actinoplanes derwentensis]
MADNLTPSESAWLIVLMSEARELSNSELAERFNITLTGKERTKLNSLGYVQSRKVGRAFAHVLDEKGWERVNQELNIVAPGAKVISVALSLMHENLRNRVLQREAYRKFSEIFSHAVDAVVPVSPETTDDDLESRIRQVYHSLAPEPGEWVRHTAVRQKLGDVPGEALDEVFRLLSRAEDVEMMPEINQKTLTAEDRRTAVRVGGQDTHLISIGTR